MNYAEEVGKYTIEFTNLGNRSYNLEMRRVFYIIPCELHLQELHLEILKMQQP